MNREEITIPLQQPVISLCWNGDHLVDWAGGNRTIGIDGKVSRPFVSWAYRFNAATQSPSGRFAAIYERTGTKALILREGAIHREINRAFYHAHAYEFPIVLFEHAGREFIAHCPDHYNQIEIDDLETGDRLTSTSTRHPCDFFHSRLAVSPGGHRLLSAGWHWHPFSSASSWSIDDVLAHPDRLDKMQPPRDACDAEISSAAFLDDDRLLLSAGPDSEMLNDEGDPPFKPNTLALFDLKASKFESIAKISEPVGTMLPIDSNHVLGFYEFPKLFKIQTGQALTRWPHLATGTQASSIIWSQPLPPVALDRKNKRFAVAAADRITIVTLRD